MQPLVPSTIGASLACPDSSNDPPLGLGKADAELLLPPVELEHPMAHAPTAATSSTAARDAAGLRVRALRRTRLNEPARACQLACLELSV